MISYDRKGLGVPGWALLAVLAAGGVAAAWWFTRDATPEAPVVQAASAPKGAGETDDRFRKAMEALQSEPEVLSDGRPADFEPDEWAALKQAMADTPNAAAELKRVADYLRYQKGLELWQNMAEQGNTPERRRLADKLLEGLPDRLGNAEITLAEGLMVCAALINESEADEGLRDQRIEQCKVRLEQAAPKQSTEDAEREASCLADWERRKAAITGSFYSKPLAERQLAQKQFETELERARVEVYGSPACANIGSP